MSVRILLLFIIWNIIGIFIFGMSARIGYCLETARLNPVYIYNDRSVNWFGAVVIALFMNVLCPVISIIYWFSKLCTIGRKH